MTTAGGPDPRFHHLRGEISVADLAAAVGGAVVRLGDRMIMSPAPIDAAESAHVAFCSGKKFRDQAGKTRAGACFVPADMADALPARTAPIIVGDPKRAFAQAAPLMVALDDAAEEARGIASRDPSAEIHDDARIGPGAVIGAGAEIGAGVQIGANSVIGSNVVIGANTRIFPNVTITHALIGARVTVQAGARIGQAGFGYAGGLEGHLPMPQLGRVVIEDDVDIGANTTIDRGAWGDTVIEAGAKIDNLVHVAHNCRIGRSAVLVGQVGVSGSSHIGAFAVLGGQVGVADHVTIGDGAQVGARAGVMRDLAPGGKYLGAPAKPAYAFFREVAALEKLAARRRRGGSDEG